MGWDRQSVMRYYSSQGKLRGLEGVAVSKPLSMGGRQLCELGGWVAEGGWRARGTWQKAVVHGNDPILWTFSYQTREMPVSQGCWRGSRNTEESAKWARTESVRTLHIQAVETGLGQVPQTFERCRNPHIWVQIKPRSKWLCKVSFFPMLLAIRWHRLM